MTGIEIGLGAAAAASAGKKSLELLVADLYNNTKDTAQKALKKWRTTREISRLYTRIANVRQVKTLWQVDKAVDLSTFYCESHVYLDMQRVRIASLADFKTNDNLLIEGIAGQGKSIFLRYLCAVELARGEFLPVFLELRRIQPNQTLVDALLVAFRELGLDLNAAMFREIAATGKVVLFLDGFDEVHDEIKTRVTTEIEHLAVTNEKLRIIVSSRLDGGLTMCSKLHVCKLSDLEGGEYKKVIFKLLEDTALSKQLITQVEKHPGGLKELLTTPLMVTLLVLGYKSYQELPAQLSDFYDSLFQVLLQRHDGVKPGYKRARACRMNDFQYRQVFEGFCFFIKQAKSRRLNDKVVHEAAQKAFQDVRIKEDAGKFICDIIKVTCLLVRDGEEYRFIHKSVQEFYAAAFIAKKPDIVVKELYQKLFNVTGVTSWHQELNFLSEIDSYRHAKFGLLPYLSSRFCISDSSYTEAVPEALVKLVRSLIEETGLAFSEDEHCPLSWISLGALINSSPFVRTFCNRIFAFNFQQVSAGLVSGEISSRFKKSSRGPNGGQVFTANLKDVLDLVVSEGEMEKAARAIAEDIFGRGKAAYDLVKREEAQESLIQFIE